MDAELIETSLAQPQRSSRLKTGVTWLFKGALVLGIFLFLWSKGLLSLDATVSAFSQPKLILPPIVVLFLLTLLGTLRWKILLDAQQMPTGFLRVLQVNMIGNFFNTALPGAVSGDFIKAFYIGNDMPGRRGNAFGSILFDRVIGLCALVLIATAALWLNWELIRNSSVLPAIRLTLTVGALGVLGFFSYLFFMPRHKDPIEKMLIRLTKWKPQAESLLKIFEGVRAYQNRKSAVLSALLISLLIHGIVSWCGIQFLRAVGDWSTPASTLYVFLPLTLLVTAVPVLPGGIGTGHAALSWGLHAVGSTRGADVFNLFFLSNLGLSLLGSLVYLLHPKRPPPQS
jgi:uncharacterized protein (TIRG00374 family)